jgi:hypothetical protein
MTVPIYEWPRDWYQFTNVTFPLRASSQTSPRPWAGGNNVYGPHVQMWLPKLTVSVQVDPVWQAMAAFFSRLGGQAGLLRIGHVTRTSPQYNRSFLPGREAWSDGTFFDDGTGFVSGLLPPTAFVLEAAMRGAIFLKIGGLPASINRALRRGDLFEIRIGGIATATPHLYEIMVDGATDSDGNIGIEIRPPLRTNVAIGDQVVLEYPTSTFHLIDDTQGDIELTAPVLANFGFSLVEAIENV